MLKPPRPAMDLSQPLPGGTDWHDFLMRRSAPTTDGCRVWAKQKSKTGYGLISLSRYSVRAHRLSYAVSVGPIPDGAVVCHRCDNPSCIEPSHLFIGTHTENMLDMARKERGTQKLSADQVREIRARHARGEVQAALAREFGVGEATISMIVRNLLRQTISNNANEVAA